MFDVLPAQPDLGQEPPLDEVAAEDVVDDLTSLFARRDRLDAQIAARLRRAGETEAFRRDGYSSLSALLRHRMSLHPGEAHRLVTRANGLAHASLVGIAFEVGALSGAGVDALLDARSMAPDPFAADERDLVALAVGTALVTDLRRQLDYWLDGVAADAVAADRELVREQRSLTLRRDGEMVRIAGWVDVEAGERLRAVLDPGPPVQGDTRSTPARRADVLLDVVNGASGRPDVIVHVAADTLGHHHSGISHTAYGTFLTADEVGRLACDANLTRVILDAASQPLDVGRTRRLVTPSMRAAICARDLRCVFPGCDRPSHWCDVHHIVSWVDGGLTAVGNLVLLCRHHHVLVHEAGWRLIGNPNSLRFLRPDGTELGSEPPPRPRLRTATFTTDPPRTLPPGGLRDIIATLPRLRAP